jgi:hypothetical protein
MADLSKSVAIVGVAESDEIGLVPNKSALTLHMEATRNAIADAGLTIGDIDGFLTAGYWGYDVAEYLGRQHLRGRFLLCYRHCPRHGCHQRGLL